MNWDMPDVPESTYDNEGRLHSYDGKPALVEVDGEHESKEWYWHGLLHRDNDMPAQVTSVENIWLLFDSFHRINGPALIHLDNEIEDMYSLFGVSLEEERWKFIRFHAIEHDYPLWVSWLLDYNLIDEEQLQVALKGNNTWSDELPVDWLVRIWGLDEKAFQLVTVDEGDLIQTYDWEANPLSLNYQNGVLFETFCRVAAFSGRIV